MFFLSFFPNTCLLLYRRFLHVVSSHYDNLRNNNAFIKIDFSSLLWKDKTESDSTKASGKVFHSLIVLGKNGNWWYFVEDSGTLYECLCKWRLWRSADRR